jgi:molecular chaperone DnaK (HSP70)
MIHLTQISLICASLWCFQGQFEVQFTGGNNSLGGLDIDMMVMTIVMMMMMMMILVK